MNTLLLNRDGFQMPADGWYQVAPLGEFAHAAAGVVQVVDRDACAAMVNRFAEDAAVANFAGLLVDFDHFSLDGEKRSEAAGWITALENRDGGLFAQIRWSDLGEEAVKGGRYRFLSPVWNRTDCVDLGGGRVRPVRLLNAAVTNDPNLKGMRPLSNSAAGREAWRVQVNTNATTVTTRYTASHAGSMLAGKVGGTNAVWVAVRAGTNGWVKIAQGS
jgi:phage I-like protein